MHEVGRSNLEDGYATKRVDVGNEVWCLGISSHEIILTTLESDSQEISCEADLVTIA